MTGTSSQYYIIFGPLFFIFWSLHCLFFVDLRLLITFFVYSSFSYKNIIHIGSDRIDNFALQRVTNDHSYNSIVPDQLQQIVFYVQTGWQSPYRRHRFVPFPRGKLWDWICPKQLPDAPSI